MTCRREMGTEERSIDLLWRAFSGGVHPAYTHLDAVVELENPFPHPVAGSSLHSPGPSGPHGSRCAPAADTVDPAEHSLGAATIPPSRESAPLKTDPRLRAARRNDPPEPTACGSPRPLLLRTRYGSPDPLPGRCVEAVTRGPLQRRARICLGHRLHRRKQVCSKLCTLTMICVN